MEIFRLNTKRSAYDGWPHLVLTFRRVSVESDGDRDEENIEEPSQCNDDIRDFSVTSEFFPHHDDEGVYCYRLNLLVSKLCWTG